MTPILKFIFSVGLSVLVNGCASVSQNNSAVVITHHAEVIKDETKYHLVKKGDNLSAISLIYNLSYRQLAQWNRIVPPYTLEIGQKLRLSAPNLADMSAPADVRRDAGSQQKITATVTNRISSQKKTSIPLDNSASLTSRLPYKAQTLKVKVAKYGANPQKKSIISIDNKNMLKLNFQWPVRGKILKYFSQADNKGIDIAGEMGQNVSATEAGKVVYSGQSLIGYGNLLIIKHNDLYLSAYANNSRLLITEGHTVEKGEVIAKIGQAGSNQAKSTQASLHFEIRKNGKPVNPLILLPGRQ
ncbi:MAG: peptidoglycan DD-metalloendopeptidase family protein [Methylobacter sp.]|nr:peptidoglycan DD-metalloendopeptidase family protein [Methylobacter sp.]